MSACSHAAEKILSNSISFTFFSGRTLKNDTSALFVLVRKATADKVLENLKSFKGKVLKTSLTADKEEELRKALA